MVAQSTFVADTMTPVSAYAALRRASADDASFLFEGIAGATCPARYSILGYRAKHEVSLQPSGHWVGAHGLPHGMRPVAGARDALDAARSLFELLPPTDDVPAHPSARFARAYFGYAAWELAHLIGVAPGRASSTGPPAARFFGRATIVVFDHVARTVTIAGEDAADVQRARTHLERSSATSAPTTLVAFDLPVDADAAADVDAEGEPEVDDASYEAMAQRAREDVAAGNARRLVLARTFSTARAGRDPFDVYRGLRALDPRAHMYFLDLPPGPGERTRTQIAGTGSQSLVRVEQRELTLSPSVGERARGTRPDLDAAIGVELLADERERAGLAALIEVAREDAARVAEPGAVVASGQMEVERAVRTMHLVGRVVGRLPPSTPPFEVLRAAFPGAAASGAPKARAIQLARRIEAGPRGLFGGAVGHVASDGSLDFATCTRAAVCREDRFWVGTGAVIDESSDPTRAVAASRAEARVVFQAIGHTKKSFQ